jgi:hypothetical protein
MRGGRPGIPGLSGVRLLGAVGCAQSRVMPCIGEVSG